MVATIKNDIELTYYYDNNLLDTNKMYDALIYGTTKAYLLLENGNNAYVLVSEIVPVAQHSRYSINVIDENGKLSLSQLVISPKIDVDKHSINYSFETKMLEELHLGVEAEHNDNFCNYLEEKYTDNSYVVKEQHSYIYNNGELSLIKNEETTIKHYKDIYNCN